MGYPLKVRFASINKFDIRIFYTGILLFWILLRSPGVTHADTSSQLEILSRGEISSQWTINYFFFIKFFSINGRTTIVILLLQLFVLLFTIRKLLFSLYGRNVNTEKAVMCFAITPFYGYYSTFLNHDLWGLCATLILTSLIFDAVISKKNLDYPLLAMGVLFSTFTYISLCAAIAFSLVFIFSKFRNVAIVAIFTILFSIALSLGVSTNKSQDMKSITLISDFKCVLQNQPKLLDDSKLKPLLTLQTKAFWLSDIGTRCLDANLIYGQLNKEMPKFTELLKAYLFILQEEPESIIKYHIVKNGYALPPPLVGLPPSRYDLNAYSSDIESIKANELFPVTRNYGFTFSFMQIPRDIVDLITYMINLRTDLIGWAGAWLLVIASILRHSTSGVNLKLFKILSPILASHAFVIIFAPVGDSRYLSSSIFMGLILVFYLFTKKLKSKFDNPVSC